MKEYRYILMGPPGVGKGTYAKYIAEKLNILHISTGDIFRFHIKNKTELGKKASEYIEKGKLVPDNLTNELVLERLSHDDVKKGFLLDGYPRSKEQAQFLETLLQKQNLKLTGAINFFADENIIISRLSGRRVCPKCGLSYHILYNKPQVDGVCECGTNLEIRKDDTAKIIKERLCVYKKSSDDLIKYYKNTKQIIDICANLDFKEQKDEVIKKLI